MKKFLHFYPLLLLMLCTGCSNYLQVTYQDKPKGKPYSRVLLVFVDEGCSFTVFDSLTYDICVKSSFLNPDKFDRRVQVEDVLSRNLVTSGTTIVKSSDVLDIVNNSYEYFRHLLDSSHFDAVLFVNYRLFEHDNSNLKNLKENQRMSEVEKRNIYRLRLTWDEGLECHLLPAGNINFAIWEAQIGTKGSTSSNGLGRYMPRGKTITDMTKILKHDGYWMP